MRPEFLSILFFQQKNLVIFPYMDLKHLHALETFTVGHNLIDIESTALYNLREIIEGETLMSYSQTPNVFLIYNLDGTKVKEIMELEGIRCILNVNENVSPLASGHRFIFYNKKTKTFLNHEVKNGDLEFETQLIESSRNRDVLFDALQRIKASATCIFKEYVETGTLDILPTILKDHPRQHWNKILNFVETFFSITLPPIDLKNVQAAESRPPGPVAEISPFAREYELIISHDRDITKEFTLTLHDYRAENVNPANLELEELINPQKLHAYLRAHHWKGGIPKEFLQEWIKMKRSNIPLTHELEDAFFALFSKLGISLGDACELLGADRGIQVSPVLKVRVIKGSPPRQEVHPLDFQQLSAAISDILNDIEKKLIGTTVRHAKVINGASIKDFLGFKNDLSSIINYIENSIGHYSKSSLK